MEKPFQYLESLSYECDEQLIRQEEVFTFAYALGKGALPMLKELSMTGAWERGAVPILLRGISKGACPLEVIHNLPIPFYGWYDGDGHLEENDDVDDEETGACTGALLEMVEKRGELGNCFGLKKLGGKWLDWMPSDVCIRVFQAVLSTLEELPECDEWEEDVLHEFVAIGAPRLMTLKLQQLSVLNAISNKPGAFMLLEELNLSFLGGSATNILSGVQALSLALAQGAWSQLRRLTIRHTRLEDEGWQVLFGALTKRHTVRGGLEELIFSSVGATNKNVEALADAFASGCFANMKKLSLTYNQTVTGLGAARLAKALRHAPLLETLELNDTHIPSS